MHEWHLLVYKQQWLVPLSITRLACSTDVGSVHLTYLGYHSYLLHFVKMCLSSKNNSGNNGFGSYAHVFS